MSITTTLLIAVAVLIAIITLWVIRTYNHLVARRNQVKNAWRQIDVQLQRRYDLIPNLIESVKGYMDFERGALEAVIQARNQAANARAAVQNAGGPTDSSIKPLAGAETVLKGAMSNFFALAENYPLLKASEHMKHLQEELSSTENKISFARQAYNDQVMGYNTTLQQFPAVLVAPALGHHSAELFEISEVEAKKPVKVSFDRVK